MNNEDKILEMLASLTETVGKLSEGQAEMRSDIAELKSTQAQQGEQLDRQGMQLSQMNGRLEEIDARSLRTAVLLEGDIAPKIQTLFEGHDELKRKIDTLATKEQVKELADDVDIIKAVVSQHSGDISKLKKAQ